MANFDQIMGFIADNMNGMFKISTATASGTVNANTNARITGSITAISGYSPVAIVQIESSAGASATVTEFGIVTSNNTVSSVIRNVSSSQISVTHTYHILFVKTALISTS